MRFPFKGLSVGCACMLTGCVGVVPVRSVQGDKLGYLQKTFALTTVNASTMAAIKAKDSGTLSFQRIVMSVKPSFERFASATTPPEMHLNVTYLNAGGPFVQVLEEESSNGVDMRQNYGLLYRNLIAVRYQTLLLSNPQSSFIMEMKSLTDLTPPQLDGSGSGAVDFHYQWGNLIQVANLSNLSLHCDYGARFPAARVNPKFQGDAQELKCESTNANGIISEHYLRALLLNYGITVPMRKQTANGTVNFKIEDVQLF
jgi:hypothetical protein